MKNILIVADGLSAKHFLDRISMKRVDSNHYSVVLAGDSIEAGSSRSNMLYYKFDPTSRSKIRELMFKENFDLAYIVLEGIIESTETYANMRAIDEKLKIFILDHWDSFEDNEDEYLKPININTQIGNKLYDQLPNVPLVAQNVGLASGEIMEVYVPSGSPFAHRHIGSIAQVKWSISAIFRNNKLILPKPHEMIKAEDTLLIIGQPKMLNTIYMRISNQSLKIPEPFGKNFYLLIDLGASNIDPIGQIKEATYLANKIGDKELFVRVVNPSNFEMIEEIRAMSAPNTTIMVEYLNQNIVSIVLGDLQTNNIGMIMTTIDTLSRGDLKSEIFVQKKLLYIFGDTPLYDVNQSIVLVGDEEETESISSISVYISKDLDLTICLCYFSPEGDFESKKNILMHYEAISEATQYPILIEKKRVNPIRKISTMEDILQIAPMSSDIQNSSTLTRFSTNVSDYLLRDSKHPKLLVPIV